MNGNVVLFYLNWMHFYLVILGFLLVFLGVWSRFLFSGLLTVLCFVSGEKQSILLSDNCSNAYLMAFQMRDDMQSKKVGNTRFLMRERGPHFAEFTSAWVRFALPTLRLLI
jgi:hypothetical protein